MNDICLSTLHTDGVTAILTSSLLYSPFDLRPQFTVPSLFQPTAVIAVDANEAATRWFWK
jgi:hypothetical protein